MPIPGFNGDGLSQCPQFHPLQFAVVYVYQPGIHHRTTSDSAGVSSDSGRDVRCAPSDSPVLSDSASAVWFSCKVSYRDAVSSACGRTETPPEHMPIILEITALISQTISVCVCLPRQRIGPSIRSGPGFCPKINTTAHGTTEILVPSGTKRNIKVKVENIAVSVGSDGSLKVTGSQGGRTKALK